MHKLFLTYIIISFFCLTSTDISGKYQIESQRSFDTLELKNDGTYEYKSRGDSCWLWHQFTGTWKLTKETLILYRTNPLHEEYHFSYKNGVVTSIKFPHVAEKSTYKKL
ncbi:hypothetical protein KORDIASMS9_03720 [Kordia sp. SMS9]|nr:hypothetical protein KORDIASMS9_03720 [Kordia sp. SMS9]